MSLFTIADDLNHGDLMSIFQPLGVVTDPSQQRAMSQAEIEQMQIAQIRSMIQAQQPFNRHYDVSNFFREPRDQRPLDERFADFKRRLADAVERNERRKDGV
jgi:hypothetical protein